MLYRSGFSSDRAEELPTVRFGFTLEANIARRIVAVDAQSPQNEVLRYAAHLLARGCVSEFPPTHFTDWLRTL